MILPPIRRSSMLAYQALVSGTILDGLTGGMPISLPVVRLADRETGDRYPLAGRVWPDGRFAFFGPPERAFPLLDRQTYQLRVEARASGYGPGSFEFDAGPAPDQPATVTRGVPLESIPDIQVRLFTGGGLPQEGIAISLDRLPVRLRGRMHVAGNPGAPIASAQLEIVGGPTVTADADGRFQFADPLPLALALEMDVTAPDFERAVINYEPDYSQTVNTLVIGLRRA